MPLPHDPGPHWGEVGIHGLHRQREWDAVVTVEADGVTGDERVFVALADGRVVAEDDAGDVTAIASRISTPAPYRARAVKRDKRAWVVAVRRIDTVELQDDPGGDFVELAWDGVERTVRIDGEPTLAGVAELERLGAARGRAYVVTASRLEGAVWEVSVALL